MFGSKKHCGSKKAFKCTYIIYSNFIGKCSIQTDYIISTFNGTEIRLNGFRCIHEFLDAACMVLDGMRGCKPYKDLIL